MTKGTNKEVEADKRIHTSALLYPRRDHDGRNSNSEPIKTEQKRLRSNDSVGARNTGDRRRNVVEESTVLIVGDDEQSFVPLRRRSKRLVDLLNEHLSLVHIVRRMIVVRRLQRQVYIPLLHHHIVRQFPLLCVPLEVQIVLVKFVHVFQFP